MPDTWYPLAIRRDGPAWKVNPSPRDTAEKKGIVVHSPEGSLVAALHSLDSDRHASWHFTLGKNGDLYQH